VAGTVDVGVVALLGLVLDVGGGDGDAAFPLLGGFVDGAVFKIVGKTLLGLRLEVSRHFEGCGSPRTCLSLGDGGRERSFPVVDMADGTNVYMGP